MNPTAGRIPLETIERVKPAFSIGGALRWIYHRAFDVPWWGIVLFLIAVFVYTRILALAPILPVPDALYPSLEPVADEIVNANPIWANAFNRLSGGISLTLRIAFFSYIGALFVGLLLGLIRSSKPRPSTGFFGIVFSLIRLAIYQFANMFVEVMRGMPLLTTLVIFAFALISELKKYLRAEYQFELPINGISIETAVIVLALAYGAFMSETFRAGIQSIEKGQIEASRALGLSYIKTMRFVVLPQAIRRILPPLGNDFVSMIKDTSLVSAIGLQDITQIAKTYSGSSFRYLEIYLTTAMIYLTLTIVLSLVVKYIERRMRMTSR